MTYIVSFDAESNGLHGAAFAIGAVVLNHDGRLVRQYRARCPVEGAVDPWVTEHVLPALPPEVTHDTAREMRSEFWHWLTDAMTLPGAVVVADCGWPVEAGLLSACVFDVPERAFKGPYPLHEVATLLLATGRDPLASYAEEVLPGQGHRKHDPVYDAHVSAFLARRALLALGLLPARRDAAVVVFETIPCPVCNGLRDPPPCSLCNGERMIGTESVRGVL